MSILESTESVNNQLVSMLAALALVTDRLASTHLCFQWWLICSLSGMPCPIVIVFGMHGLAQRLARLSGYCGPLQRHVARALWHLVMSEASRQALLQHSGISSLLRLAQTHESRSLQSKMLAQVRCAITLHWQF